MMSSRGKTDGADVHLLGERRAGRDWSPSTLAEGPCANLTTSPLHAVLCSALGRAGPQGRSGRPDDGRGVQAQIEAAAGTTAPFLIPPPVSGGSAPKKRREPLVGEHLAGNAARLNLLAGAISACCMQARSMPLTGYDRDSEHVRFPPGPRWRRYLVLVVFLTAIIVGAVLASYCQAEEPGDVIG